MKLFKYVLPAGSLNVVINWKETAALDPQSGVRHSLRETSGLNRESELPTLTGTLK